MKGTKVKSEGFDRFRVIQTNLLQDFFDINNGLERIKYVSHFRGKGNSRQAPIS